MSATTPSSGREARCLVVIGASTGGTRVLPEILERLPSSRAGILIVQHMPKFINESLARTLTRHAGRPVKLVTEGDVIREGDIFLAPSEAHTIFTASRRLGLIATPPVHFVRPAVDVAMLSLPPMRHGDKLISVILTGMGRDGADGLAHMKKLGAVTIAQSKETCAVYGMPAQAVATGCVDHVLPPDRIARLIEREVLAWNTGQNSG